MFTGFTGDSNGFLILSSSFCLGSTFLAACFLSFGISLAASYLTSLASFLAASFLVSTFAIGVVSCLAGDAIFTTSCFFDQSVNLLNFDCEFKSFCEF